MPAMTYSRAGRTTIGPGCLSAVFGMGTGVSTRAWSPAVRVRAPLSPFGVVAAAVYGGTRWCEAVAVCAVSRGSWPRPVPGRPGVWAVRPNGRLLVPVG